MSQERDGENRVVTLAQFLAENDTLLAALGIFSGLAVFSQDLGIKSVASFLSFLFLGLTVVTWLELRMRFPEKVREQTLNLYVFRLLLEIALIGIIVYWFVWFHDVWRTILILPLWGACMYLIGVPAHRILRRFGWRERIYSKSARFRMRILGAFFDVGIAVGAFKLASLLLPPLTQMLDTLSQMVP